MTSFYGNGGGEGISAKQIEKLRNHIIVSEKQPQPDMQQTDDIWLKTQKFGIWPIASKLILSNGLTYRQGIPINFLLFLNRTNNKALFTYSEEAIEIAKTAISVNNLTKVEVREMTPQITFPLIYGTQPGSDRVIMTTSNGDQISCETRVEDYTFTLNLIKSEDDEDSYSNSIELYYLDEEAIPETEVITQRFRPCIQVMIPLSEPDAETGDTYRTVKIEKEYFTLKYYQMETINPPIAGDVHMDIDLENQIMTLSNLTTSRGKATSYAFVAELNHPIYGTGVIINSVTIQVSFYS